MKKHISTHKKVMWAPYTYAKLFTTETLEIAPETQVAEAHSNT